MRLVSTGCIKVVCIVRRRRYSNAWTMRASLSTKRCGTTLIARRSTSNAIPTRLIFHRNVAMVSTTRSVERGLQHSGLKAGIVLCPRWRRRQAGGIHDDASKHHQRRHVRHFGAVVRRRSGRFGQMLVQVVSRVITQRR